MDTYIVKVSYLPRGNSGLVLSTTIAGCGDCAADVARTWAHDNALKTYSIVGSTLIPSDGSVIDVR